MSAGFKVPVSDSKGINEFAFTLSRMLSSASEEMQSNNIELALVETRIRLILINSLLGFCIQNGTKPEVITRIESFFDGILVIDVEYYLEREIKRLLITILES